MQVLVDERYERRLALGGRAVEEVRRRALREDAAITVREEELAHSINTLPVIDEVLTGGLRPVQRERVEPRAHENVKVGLHGRVRLARHA